MYVIINLFILTTLFDTNEHQMIFNFLFRNSIFLPLMKKALMGGKLVSLYI